MSPRQGAVVQAPRFSDQIYGLLREELKSGKIAPGAHVTETELAVRFGVSRTPVREALMQLRREGLIAAHRARGVRASDRGSSRQFEEAREIAETALASLAASRAGLRQRHALAQALQVARDQAQAGEVQAFAAASARFRAVLGDMAENAVLAGFAASLDGGFEGLRRQGGLDLELARLTKLFSLAQGGAALAPALMREAMTA